MQLRPLIAGWLGFFIVSYDGALATVVMGPAFAYFLPADASPLLIGALILSNFNASRLGRPFGAYLFGRMVDRGAAARAGVISAGFYAVLLMLCAFLPGYAQSGYLGIVLLLALRAVTGIFLAGQSVAFGPAQIQNAPLKRRWLIGALLPSGSSASYIVAALLTLSVIAIAPIDGLESPYVQWGWRIAFVAGAIISAACFAVAISLRGTDKPRVSSAVPRTELQRQRGRSAFLRILLLLAGVQIVLSTSVAALPGYLVQVRGYAAEPVSWAIIVAYVLIAFAYVTAGWLAARFGATRVFIVWAIVATVIGVAILHAIGSVAPGSYLLEALGGLVVVTVTTLSVAGFMHTYVIEAFDPAVLATSYGAARSLAEFVPVFSGFYLIALSALFGDDTAPAVLLGIGGVLVVAGALLVDHLNSTRPDRPALQGDNP